MRLTAPGLLLLAGFLTPVCGHGQDIDMYKAHAAYDSGLAYKGRGDLNNAQQFFATALAHAPDGSTLSTAARDELDYFLPLMRVQRSLWQGQTTAAEQALGELAGRFADNPQRHAAISDILAGVRSSRDAPAVTAPVEVDEQLIAETVRSKLARHYRMHRRFPRRADLAGVVGLPTPAMAMFEVARYVTSDRGYLLVLRNKNRQDHTLTLENTGLLE